jgi:hypothetical protein
VDTGNLIISFVERFSSRVFSDSPGLQVKDTNSSISRLPNDRKTDPLIDPACDHTRLNRDQPCPAVSISSGKRRAYRKCSNHAQEHLNFGQKIGIY